MEQSNQSTTYKLSRSRLIIIASLLPRPPHNLPPIAHKPRNRHARSLIHSVNPPPSRRRHQHFMLQRFLHAEHHPVRAAEAEGGSGVFDGFGGVFDLEDAAVGGEGGGGEVVA
jgi:hypothetical protein